MSELNAVPVVPALVRVAGWEERLEALLVQRLQAPFVWGQFDCCMWAADVVLAVTGVDMAAAERGAYSTAEGAADVLAGVGGVLGLAWARLSPVAPLVPLGLATVGDVGVVRQPNGVGCTMVANVGGRWVGAGVVGLVDWPAQQVLLAWRIGGGV